MCGESMSIAMTEFPDQPEYNLGLTEVTVNGQYYSTHLLDTNCYQFSLCEKCLRNMFEQFKIKPLIYDSFASSHLSQINWTYEKDKEIYEYQIWREEGGLHQAYLAGKCNAIKNCSNDAVYTIFYEDEFTENSCCETHKKIFERDKFVNFSKFIKNELKIFL